MRLLVAREGGYCFGVRRAVQAVEGQLKVEPRIYTLGPLMHNPGAVAALEQKGAHAVSGVAEVPPGAVVVLRSHGVGPDVIAQCRERGLRVVDATCPFVARIQRMAHQAVAQGKAVIVAGQAEHPEVRGIVGWAGSAYVVGSAADVQALPEMDDAVLLVQTTFAVDALPPIEEALHKRCRHLEVQRTICDATARRQWEAREIAAQCDVVLVVGGRQSSNTQKLLAIARQQGARAYLIESADQIMKDWVFSAKAVGILAGASTPDERIKEVVVYMSELDQTQATEVNEQTPAVDTACCCDEGQQCCCQDTPSCDCTCEGKCDCQEDTPATCCCEGEACANGQEAKAADGDAQDNKDEDGDVNFSETLDKTLVQLRRGSIMKGTVVQVTDDEVCVNIGYKSDGIIARRDLSNDPNVRPQDMVAVGDEIEVEVIKVNDGEGNVVLSKKNVDARKAWDKLAADLENGASFTATVKEVVKGGMVATTQGARIFIPASHASLRFMRDLSKFVGQEIGLKVLEMNKQRKQIVASHKLFLEEEAEKKKAEAWANVPEPGTLVHSVVRRITDFGAFCDIGGVDGLLHISDMAWGRPSNPRDIVKPGDELTVMILSVDPERGRVSLGLKQLMPKPWEIAPEKYPVGTVVTGRVVRTTTFGAFVELEPGLDGLVHISQLAKHRVEKVEDAVKPGDLVKVIVLDVNPEAKRISLSIRQAMDDDEDVAAAVDTEGADEQESYEIPAATDSGATLGDIFPELLNVSQAEEDKE
nr:bifunctional 4-hydroxy-3-methylbut-2-enyl diphosphate reductase/30S ribosomal protein S1 [bacterium]